MSDIKSNETEDMDFSKYGTIFRCLRIVKDKSLNDIAENLSTPFTHLNKIERGERMPTLISFISLCSGYDIKPREFMQIAEKVYDENLTYQEILLECAKYESIKNLPNLSMTREERRKKLGLILKSMRVAQGKTGSIIAKEFSILSAEISQVETGKRIPSIETFKKYISFFKISDEDFDILYKTTIKNNLSYPQILTYCLIYDIGRQKKEKLQTHNQ